MIKHLKNTFLVLAIIFAFLPSLAKADTHSGTFGKNGDNLIWEYDDQTKTLTISGTGEMEDWQTGYLTPWGSYQMQITTVVINDGVTNIGKEAFSNHHALTSVTLPNSVTDIRFHAFQGSENLANIDLPANLTTIGDAAFYGCHALTDVTIPDSVKTIGYNAFAHMDNLTNVVIGKNVETIESYAFSFTPIQAITIPKSVKAIYDNVFDNCDDLTTIIYEGTLEQWNALINSVRLGVDPSKVNIDYYSYTVKFMANGHGTGTFTGGVIYELDVGSGKSVYDIENDSINDKIYITVKEGDYAYEVYGYSDDDSCSNTSIYFNKNDSVIKDTDWYACWSKTGAYVEYNVNGGGGEIPSVLIDISEPVEKRTFEIPIWDEVSQIITAPNGKEYDGVMIDRKKYSPGKSFTVEKNTTVVLNWKTKSSSSRGGSSDIRRCTEKDFTCENGKYKLKSGVVCFDKNKIDGTDCINEDTNSGTTNTGSTNTGSTSTGITNTGTTTNENSNSGTTDSETGFSQTGTTIKECVISGELSFTDIDDTFAKCYIQDLANQGFIKGYGDRTFRPENNITRAEYLAIVMRSLKIDLTTETKHEFKDLAETSDWTKYVNKAIDLGIISSDNEYFRPDEAITREEAMKILVMTGELGVSSATSSTFGDVEGWSVKYVEKVKELFIISSENENFRPTDNITRAEVAKIVYNVINLKK